MDTAKLISKARETRDSSIARVEPPLAPLPVSLPKNVTKIPSQYLTARELEITALDAPELLKAIRDKVYSSEDVTRAFLRRAAIAQKLVSDTYPLLPIQEPRRLILYRQTASQSSFPSEPSSEQST